MRHGSNNRRNRNRNGRNRSGNSGKSQVYDSNGPDVRIRGTAHQISEKYQALAKDSSSSGDRIMAESYLQHAEHYLRIIGSFDSSVREKTHRQHKPKQDVEDDLSLPSSLLGDKVDVSSQEKAVETA